MGDGVAVALVVAVAVEVGVGVPVLVGVPVRVGLRVGVALMLVDVVAVSVGVDVGVAVALVVAVEVLVGTAVSVGVLVAVDVGVPVLVAVAVGVRVGVGVFVGVAVEPPSLLGAEPCTDLVVCTCPSDSPEMAAAPLGPVGVARKKAITAMRDSSAGIGGRRAGMPGRTPASESTLTFRARAALDGLINVSVRSPMASGGHFKNQAVWAC